MYNKLDKVDVHEASQMSIIDTDRDLARVQQEQLFQGLRSDGKRIKPGYATSTKDYKRKKGQPFDRVTLKDTGQFYSGILIDVRGETFVITSADEKTGKLEDKYGFRIFGLNKESRIEYNPILRKALLNRLRAAL